MLSLANLVQLQPLRSEGSIRILLFQCKFPQVSVIVEPPSPVLTEQMRSERLEHIRVEIEGELDHDLELLCSKERDRLSDKSVSNNSSSSNLLGISQENFLTRSPAATRRISCCSMLNPAEAAALAAAAASSKFYESSAEKKDPDKRDKDKEENQNRKLPIINPLVRLPTWPSKYSKTAKILGIVLDLRSFLAIFYRFLSFLHYFL